MVRQKTKYVNPRMRKSDIERRLSFLRSLPTESEAVRSHILQEQKANATPAQVASWQEWIVEETTALEQALAEYENGGRCVVCNQEIKR